MYTREIAGEYQAAQCAGQARDPGPIQWAGWRVPAGGGRGVKLCWRAKSSPISPTYYVPADCPAAGQAAACRRVVDKIGRQRCVENENEIIADHPAGKKLAGGVARHSPS